MMATEQVAPWPIIAFCLSQRAWWYQEESARYNNINKRWRWMFGLQKTEKVTVTFAVFSQHHQHHSSFVSLCMEELSVLLLAKDWNTSWKAFCWLLRPRHEKNPVKKWHVCKPVPCRGGWEHPARWEKNNSDFNMKTKHSGALLFRLKVWPTSSVRVFCRRYYFYFYLSTSETSTKKLLK